MELATLPLRIYQKLGIRKLVYALGIKRLLPGQLRDMESMLPHLPKKPLRQVLPVRSEPATVVRYRVGFFLGCAQNLMFSDESAATVRVLNRNGCSVTTPKDTQCCGMPAIGYGKMDQAKAQARFNIALFEKSDVDVDCYGLRHLWLNLEGLW